jgi:formyltetrahydrofolate-dependent phosphoribosylglycinamide formyltransferase
MKKIAVLISGSGTNLRNLAEKCEGSLKNLCKIAIVISSREGVKGLEIAEEFGLKSVVLKDVSPKVSISSSNTEDYNKFVNLKQKAEKSLNILKNLGLNINLANLMEICLTNISHISDFPEEDLKELVLTDLLYNSLSKNNKESTDALLSQIDSTLYEVIEDIKEIANLFECIKKNPNFIKFLQREKYDEVLHNFLIQEEVEYIFLAGFMRILSPSFVQKWQDKIYNIHPSLLPAFTGGKAVKEALKYGVKITGATVHLVNAGVDSGQIIAQKAVEVLKGDTEETLHERIKKAEKDIYPQVLENLIKNTL